MSSHERSPHIDNTMFEALDMPGLPVGFFMVLTSEVALYAAFKKLSSDERHQVVESFYSTDMVTLFPSERERMAIVIKGIKDNNYSEVLAA